MSKVKGGGPNGEDGFSNSVTQGHNLERVSQALKIRSAMIKHGVKPEDVKEKELVEATDPSKHKKAKF